jgi:hypothetical protein
MAGSIWGSKTVHLIATGKQRETERGRILVPISPSRVHPSELASFY